MFGTKRLLAVAALAFVAGLAGSACDDDDDLIVVDGRIAEIDLNNDGVVDVQEWNAAFGVWDVDDNGVLVENEFLFNRGAFDDVDINNDALIDINEWNAALDELDIDDDAVVDELEFDPFL